MRTLLFLLREHAGIDARIEAPQEWRDPVLARPPAVEDEPGPTSASQQLRSGQNVTIDGDKLTVTLAWRTGQRDLDASALLLGDDGRVRSDADFIFYNQPVTPDGSVQHTGKTIASATTTEDIDITLDTLSASVNRIVIAVSVDGGTIGTVQDLRVTITPAGSSASYAFAPTATVETALVCTEIYRRDGRWRLRAIGQGYNDGLAGLARDFGVDVGN